MNIPQAALQNYRSFRERGTLGAKAERYPVAPEAFGTPQTPNDRQQNRLCEEAAGHRVSPKEVAQNLGVSIPTL